MARRGRSPRRRRVWLAKARKIRAFATQTGRSPDRTGLRAEGLEVRIGLHTAECVLSAGDVSGIAVHAGARIEAAAERGQILVSQTVRDLTAGSGIHYEDAGLHVLKGLDGKWQLYAVPD